MRQDWLMPNRKYSDATAKLKLENEWRYRPTSDHWPGPWVRTRPSTGKATMPALVRPGSEGTLDARTEPDGMYVRLTPNAVTADVLAIEVCGLLQNLHDKRSRYAASTTSMLLKLNRPWLVEQQPVQNGTKARWETFGSTFSSAPTDDLFIPVFRLRLFLLAPCDQVENWRHKVALEAHEYLLPHRALDNQYSPSLIAMLRHAFDPREWVP